jgi:hypothetical protein
MPGAQGTRSLAREIIAKCARVFTAEAPASPGIPARNGFNGYFALSSESDALLPPSPCGLKVLSDPVEPNEPPQDLTRASRRQDHAT